MSDQERIIWVRNNILVMNEIIEEKKDMGLIRSEVSKGSGFEIEEGELNRIYNAVTGQTVIGYLREMHEMPRELIDRLKETI